MSGRSAEASTAAFENLMTAVSDQMPLGTADKTLEHLVKELLRPVLKEWLDQNLPAIVEAIVRDEVERVAARAGRRRHIS